MHIYVMDGFKNYNVDTIPWSRKNDYINLLFAFLCKILYNVNMSIITHVCN